MSENTNQIDDIDRERRSVLKASGAAPLAGLGGSERIKELLNDINPGAKDISGVNSVSPEDTLADLLDASIEEETDEYYIINLDVTPMGDRYWNELDPGEEEIVEVRVWKTDSSKDGKIEANFSQVIDSDSSGSDPYIPLVKERNKDCGYYFGTDYRYVRNCIDWTELAQTLGKIVAVIVFGVLGAIAGGLGGGPPGAVKGAVIGIVLGLIEVIWDGFTDDFSYGTVEITQFDISEKEFSLHRAPYFSTAYCGDVGIGYLRGKPVKGRIDNDLFSHYCD